LGFQSKPPLATLNLFWAQLVSNVDGVVGVGLGLQTFDATPTARVKLMSIGVATAAGVITRAVAIARKANTPFFMIPPGIAIAGICPDYTLCEVLAKG
jgi:hypothetical protein